MKLKFTMLSLSKVTVKSNKVKVRHIKHGWLHRWGKAEMGRQRMPKDNPKYLRSVLEDVIYLVRFPLMDNSDYSRKVALAPIRILTADERIELRDYFDIDPDER